MTADENKRIIIDTWKAFGTRDAEQIRQYFREDAIWIAQDQNATALVANETGNLTGADKIADFIAKEVPGFSRRTGQSILGASMPPAISSSSRSACGQPCSTGAAIWTRPKAAG